MPGIANPNLPTLYVADQRAGEVPNADWAGGLNTGGGCNVGIGINTGDYDPKTSDWSGVDQFAAARDPQNTQNIGQATGPITADQGADQNDTLGFVNGVITAEVAPDATGGDGTTSAVNKTGLTIPVGGRFWGPQTVVQGQGEVRVIDPTGVDAGSPARIGVSNMFNTGQQITVDYTVDGGPVRTVVYDVLSPENEVQAAQGLANEFTVDPDVQATQLDQPVNHTAIWSPVGPVNIVSAQVS